MRALDDAIKIIDEVSFPIDTNDRQQVGGACVTMSMALFAEQLISCVIMPSPLCELLTCNACRLCVFAWHLACYVS